MDIQLSSSSTVRLILERIPFDLTESGLWNFLLSRKICPLLDLKLVKRRRYRDFMERCTNHAYLTLETNEEAERFIQEIHAKPPLNLTVRVIELGGDDRPAPTYDSGEEIKFDRQEEPSSSPLSKSSRVRMLKKSAIVVNTNSNGNDIKDPVLDTKLPAKAPSSASSNFHEVTIHEPRILLDDQDSFRYNTPIILTDVKKTDLPPCAACYQPSQYLCRHNLREAYCSRKCQGKCVIARRQLVEKKEQSKKDDSNIIRESLIKKFFNPDSSGTTIPLPSYESDSSSLSPFTSTKTDPSESLSIKEKGSNPDDDANNADTINSSIPSVDDIKIVEALNPKMNLNEFLMSDSDSSQDSLPPFTSFRKIGHLDETNDSGQKEDSTAESHPPPVPNLDLISGLGRRALLLSPSEKEFSCSTENASIHPKSSSYQVFDSDTDTIPLPSTDDSSYTPFMSTKSEAEQSLESPPPLRSAIAMKNPQHDLNGNPRFGSEQITTDGIYIPGIKVRREDSTSSDDSLPPFKYFRDEGNQMVPLGRTPSPPVNKENYLNALNDLGETIGNLKISEGASSKKTGQVNRETQTESSEIQKSNAGTQTDLQRDNTATQTYFQTSQTGTQTEKFINERIDEKERKSAVKESTITKKDVSAEPEASSLGPYSLSPDDPLSYFSLPQTEFEARILHFKSQSQIFVCTKSTFAKLRALQVKI